MPSNAKSRTLAALSIRTNPAMTKPRTRRWAKQKDDACGERAGSNQTKSEHDWRGRPEVEYRHANDDDDQAHGKNCIDNARQISTHLHGHQQQPPGKERAQYRQTGSCKGDRLDQRTPDKPESWQHEYNPAQLHQR